MDDILLHEVTKWLDLPSQMKLAMACGKPALNSLIDLKRQDMIEYKYNNHNRFYANDTYICSETGDSLQILDHYKDFVYCKLNQQHTKRHKIIKLLGSSILVNQNYKQIRVCNLIFDLQHCCR
jgi:hypothetical protein